MASAWIFLQYAECFVGGFLTSYLLCSRSPKNPVEKEANTVYDDEQTEIVMITEETATNMSNLKNDYSCEGIADGKQEEQAKQNPEEAKCEQERQENEDKKH